jgi:hypothetical protein
MSLLPREQHELRQIEDAMSRRDPSLATWLSGRVRVRRPRLVIAAAYLLAPALVVVGALLDILPLLVVGIVVAVVTPLVAKALVFRRRVGTPRGYDVLDDL